MPDFKIINRVPTVDEYLSLRKATQWQPPKREVAQNALNNSLHGVCLEYEGSIVGCGRIVGDDNLYFFIQDVIVHPDFQSQGGGRLMLNELMAYLTDNATSGAFIGIFSGHSTDSFIEKYSFLEKQEEHISSGLFFIHK